MPRSVCAPARRPRAGRRRTGGGAPTNCSHGPPRRAPDGYGPGGAAGELVAAQSRAVTRGVVRYSLLRAGDSRARGGRVDRCSGRIRPLCRSNSTALQVESTSANGRVDHSVVASRKVSRGDSTPHARSSGRTGGRLAHPTRPSPFGESPSAAVDSPPRVGPRRGRIRPPPLPVSPPLPLQALPRGKTYTASA